MNEALNKIRQVVAWYEARKMAATGEELIEHIATLSTAMYYLAEEQGRIEAQVRQTYFTERNNGNSVSDSEQRAKQTHGRDMLKAILPAANRCYEGMRSHLSWLKQENSVTSHT